MTHDFHVQAPGKLKLLGFNNLTKTLSFNIYDICYAKSIKRETHE
jgi:S-adenosylmethionine decarboxylase